MTDAAMRAWAVLAEPLTAADSRTWWLALALTLAIGVGWTGSLRAAIAPHLWVSASGRLDLQLYIARRLLGVLLPLSRLGLGLALGRAVANALDAAFGAPSPPWGPAPIPAAALSVGYTLALFVAWDLSRWALHRLMHEVPLLWQFHQVHHSADGLTPLTFHRVHPVESALYELRAALVGGLVGGLAFWLWRGAATELVVVGVNAIGLVANIATGNLRHSHLWIRFPASVERWLLSPAQHQLHHGVAREDQAANYGTWLAVWDRLTGTLRAAPERPPAAFGLAPADRNHGDDLASALFGPLVACVRLARGSRGRGSAGPAGIAGIAAAAVVAAGATRASAADPEPTPGDTAPAPAAQTDAVRDAEQHADDGDAPYEVLVVGPRGVPHVGGSAHVVSAEELARWSYGDIHRVLEKVPGVQVRGEDGFGLRPNIGMRGASSDRSAKIALMQDGIPLAPAPYAAPAAYYFPLSSRIVGIEVYKGAAAIRHGPQTIGGAVDFATRPVPERTEGELDLGVGLRSTAQGYGTIGWIGRGGRVGGRIEGAHLSTRGFKQLDGGGNTGFSRQDVGLKLAATAVPAGRLRAGVDLALDYGHESSNETYLGLSAEDFAATPYRRYAASALDHMRWNHTEESVTGWLSLGHGLELRSTAYHRWLGRAWTKFNRFADGPDVHDLLLAGGGGQSDVYLGILQGEVDGFGAEQDLMIGTNDRTFHNGGLANVAVLRADAEHVGSTLELGLRVHVDDVIRLHTEDPYAMTDGRPVATGGDRLVTLDAHSAARAIAAYAAEDARFGPVHVLPGLRVEQIRTRYGTRATGAVDPVDHTIALPGVGVYAELLPWLDALAGVHRGFSPVPPGSADDAVPETAWSTEGGLRLQAGQARAEAVAFHSAYANLAGECTLSGGCSEGQLDQQFDAGQATVAGVETLAELALLLPHRVSIGVNGAWTYTHSAFRTGFDSAFPQWGDVEAGDALPYVPVHQGSASVVADVGARVSASVTAVARGPMRDTAGQSPLVGDEAELGTIPGMVLVDATVHVRPTDRIDAHVTATNLTNAVVLESWRPYGARPAAPFQLSFGVTVRSPPPARW